MWYGIFKKERNMPVILSWLGHASFLISGSSTVYIDPWKIDGEPHDGDLVLVSHNHYDHLSPEDIRAVSKEEGRIVGSQDVVDDLGYGEVLNPGGEYSYTTLKVQGVAAYNVEKEFHPKENGWLGFIIEIDGKRIYYAGDTDSVKEMESLENIDVALLPVGGTYTFSAEEAAAALSVFKPKKVIPYHWGAVVGHRKDAVKFSKKTDVPVEILSPMDSIYLE